MPDHKTPQAPVAAVRPHKTTVHDGTRIDNYFWLRERENQEVIDYLEAENAYTDAMMDHTKDLQENLFQEMKRRIKETDLSVPWRDGNYYYYSRTEEGQQYGIICRKKGNLEADEEILLDLNELAEGHDYFSLGNWTISTNDQLLAYSTDTDGSETFTVFVKDLRTGELLPDRIENTYYSLEWANDNQTLFYNVIDDASRPWRLYRHRLGDDPANDVLVHQEDDDAFFLDVWKTRSNAFLMMQIDSNITSEVHFLDANQPESDFQLIKARQAGIEYGVRHHKDQFLIITNEGALNFKLMSAPISDPRPENWQALLPHRNDVLLDGVLPFKNHLVYLERFEGLKQMRIENLQSGDVHTVKFPEPVYAFGLHGNAEYDTDIVRFTYTSLLTPSTVFDYNLNTRERELKKQTEVLGGYDPDRYQSERLFATAADGQQVPISLVYRKDLQRDGSNPLLLNGYGSYGVNREPTFSSIRLSLLDRGFVFALAHIRGGCEMGRHWYEDGKMLNKKNTFSDFIACGEHLIAEKFTSAEKLAIKGGSAGGLLMGAVINMRPDLFGAVIANVPFVDVVNTMLDDSIPLTVTEYDEWGNPNDPEYYHYILSYSPYDNIAATDYPHLLITAGLNDPRVQYWEPAKWTAKLRATSTGGKHLLLKTFMGAGHGGSSGRYDFLRDIAFEYAFLIDLLAEGS